VSRSCHSGPLALFILCQVFLLPVSAQSPADPDPLANLRPGHPRLLATAADWPLLRERIAADPLAATFHAGLMTAACQALDEPPAR
jgi:hypothetical protein